MVRPEQLILVSEWFMMRKRRYLQVAPWLKRSVLRGFEFPASARWRRKVLLKCPLAPIASISERLGTSEQSARDWNGFDLCTWIPAAQSGRLVGRVPCLTFQDAAGAREELVCLQLFLIQLGVSLTGESFVVPNRFSYIPPTTFPRRDAVPGYFQVWLLCFLDIGS